jgi:hypothetical protein
MIDGFNGLFIIIEQEELNSSRRINKSSIGSLLRLGCFLAHHQTQNTNVRAAECTKTNPSMHNLVCPGNAIIPMAKMAMNVGEMRIIWME